MNFFKLFFHANLFINFFKSSINFVSYLAKEKKISNGLAAKCFDDFEVILKSGAIDFPSVDEIQLAEALDKIKLSILKNE